ncbi:hypothetical protein [Flavivirga rizhaonensis]|uniref:PNPLA domain-containing protein n=1 Tax=Flavivirga rizhaonensis TaxID=2559571 RepID=A0A4S1DXA1_9FLAO|nr:hypothetical protein [Flavivirga rizhaonensis]TGV02689.1 hypothetical protein EM932_09655 [Flavivirga rizhaonensis]
MLKNKDLTYNPFKYFIRNGISKRALFIFILLSIAMVVFAGIFKTNGFIDHPQFSDKIILTDWFEALEISSKIMLFYKLFFYTDFIWAISLLYVMGCYVYTKAKKNTSNKWFFWLFLIVAIAAYTFDVVENICYLIKKSYPETIAQIKEVFYAFSLIILLLVVLKYSIQNRLTIIWGFIKSSYISLIILFIIGSALPKVPQVNSIVVRLYENPIQFVFVLLGLFAPIFCVALSHYPNYFLLKNGNKIPEKDWRMSKRFWLFGTIWYIKKPEQGSNKPKSHKNYENYINFLRRTLGVFFYVALFYMIAYTADTNFVCGFSVSDLSFPLLIALIWWLYVLKKKKEKWQFYNKDLLNIGDIKDDTTDFYFTNEEEENPKLYSINKPMFVHAIFLIITLVIHLVLLILLLSYTNIESPYNQTTVIISLLCIVFQAITYVYYRTYRSIFRYVFFNSKVSSVFYAFTLMNLKDEEVQIPINERKNKIKDYFKNHDFTEGNPLLKFFSKIRLWQLSFGAMSNNVIFLQILIHGGFINLFFLIFVNLFPEKALGINAIIIILSYFYLFYGIIVILIKHFIYYNKSGDVYAKQNKKHFFFSSAAAVLIVLVLNITARFIDATKSHLYHLEQIERKPSDELSLKDYVSKLNKDSNQHKPRYYIGCYGGGMKANAWTMTVLNEIISTNPDFIKNTVCLSGASGGTIGLINTTMALSHKENNIDSTIDSIATENILAMDLTHLLGRDLFSHLFVPVCDLKGKDRSTSAMKVYADYSGFDMDQFNSTAYRNYWKNNMYKQDSIFPILIANTTNIKGSQGMAVSVKVDSKHKDIESLLYMGADDILELGSNRDKTLSFYNAVSTTNRFPLISPAATIEGKGQYNDGGIYENSGLLSAYKLYNAVNKMEQKINTTDSVFKMKHKEDVFVNIVNDKDLFIKYYLKDHISNCKDFKINESSEMSAIISAVAATEMFPLYIKNKLSYLAQSDDSTKDKTRFISIYLPHKFTFEDVKNIYGKIELDVLCIKKIKDRIKDNDKYINCAMNICSDCKNCPKTCVIIEPALSRVIAKPAHHFMKAMLKHKDVVDNIMALDSINFENKKLRK